MKEKWQGTSQECMQNSSKKAGKKVGRHQGTTYGIKIVRNLARKKQSSKEPGKEYNNNVARPRSEGTKGMLQVIRIGNMQERQQGTRQERLQKVCHNLGQDYAGKVARKQAVMYAKGVVRKYKKRVGRNQSGKYARKELGFKKVLM